MDIIAQIKDRGMTVAAVARKAGVSRVAVYALRDGKHKPSLETVVAIAKAMGVPPSVIRPELLE
jgi:lambda repressor-like predicted transcriptional regulator